VAHYRALIQGNRGEVSRLGTKKSGMKAVVNAWGIGVKVEVQYENGENVFRVYKTGGSNNNVHHVLVVEIRGA